MKSPALPFTGKEAGFLCLCIHLKGMVCRQRGVKPWVLNMRKLQKMNSPFTALLLMGLTFSCTPGRQGPAPGRQTTTPTTAQRAETTPEPVKATAQLQESFEESSNPQERKQLASEAVDKAMGVRDYAEAARWLLKLHALETDPAQRTALEGEFAELSDEKLSAREVREILEECEGTAFPAELLTYKLARIQYHVRDLSNSAEYLQKYLAQWPTGIYAKNAAELLGTIEARGRVNAQTIGVLLPLSGYWGTYGRWARQAIELAFQGSSVRLVFKDTKGDPARASQMVRELVLSEGVMGVLGPVLKAESSAAAVEAQRMGVPLLTPSRVKGVTEYGPFVFRNGITYRAEVAALVEYAMEIRGMRRFAILAPRHPYGEELTQHFWDEVEARGGEIRGIENYAADATTFSGQVKALVARDNLDARSDYHKALRECKKQPDSYRKARCREKARKNLKPLVDFDGLFIPDSARAIRMIAAALAAEDIIVEQDPRRLRILERTLGRKVNPVTLLGTGGWNSPKITESTGRTVENAVFPDGFFVGADNKQVASFVRAYREKYQGTPKLYPQAVFFDSAKILRTIFEKQRPQSREDLRTQLRSVHNYPGVTGKTSFARGNDAQKELLMLTIKNGSIQEIPKPDALPPQEAPGAKAAPGSKSR